jgi:integrase
MSTKPRKIPSYRLHKPTGQAVVRLDGRDHYLGKHGTEESQEKYNGLIARWLTSGYQILPASNSTLARPDLSLNELILAFWKHAETHYRGADGETTRELDNMRDALRPLRKLFGSTSSLSFGPLALRSVRDEMIRSGLSRTTVNARINRIRRIFRWGVGVELISPSVYQAIQAVPGLQRGRTKANEPEDVEPVPIEHFEATLPHLPRQVGALVRLQLLTGARPEEILLMRGCNLSLDDPNWEYRPGKHKNAWRGMKRIIPLGPKAQAIVKEFLKPDLGVYLFSPKDAVEELRARRACERKTKRTPSELVKKRKERPKVQPGDHYTRRSYRLAIIRACAKAGVPEWSPLQLRHTAATMIRSKYGLEAAQTVLGHSKADVTQIYAERDLAKAHEVMAEIG